MKIAIRTRAGNGFWKEVENIHSKNTCDFCGNDLWANPGGQPYCNSWTADHDQPGRYTTLKTDRKNDVTVSLTFDLTEDVYRLEWIRASEGNSNNGGTGEEEYQNLAEAMEEYPHAFKRHALEGQAA